ncbi:hypothetical protein SAMN05421858_4152 [Haladaptatus litoreus]|uniref:Uncharacterized protein n=1 Tax=Haladaptatus litoreus TaxID=553468 RepID=A0A1N7EA14_9EURY|nr:hypothetical protein [Haladaptatus litoreus]SIR84894.1 hypothetical protein SAMN05421858_4152 [Haladaptatus litoreus]
MTQEPTCEMVVSETGWIEIRNPDETDEEWLMSDTAVEVRQ